MWKTVKLDDVVKYGKTNGQGSNLPYVGMENISSDTMEIVGEIEIPSTTSATFEFNEGYVLYGRLRPYLKKILVPKFEGQCSSEIFCLKPNDDIDRKFLAYWLLSPIISKRINNTCTGARMPRANMNALLHFDFPLPPLAEQQRIVAKLDAAFTEIDAAIAATERKKGNAQQIFKNLLDEHFSKIHTNWTSSQLKQITSKIGSGATPRGGKRAYKAEGISLIRSMNVHDMRFKWKNLAKIDNKQAGKLSYAELYDGDVLLNITGASVARCCVVNSDALPARVNQHVSVIRVQKDTIIPKLLAYELVSKTYKNMLLEVGNNGGATRQAITKKQIEEFFINYPKDITEQEKLIRLFDTVSEQTRNLSTLYEEQINNYHALKSAILTQELKSEAA